MSNDKKYPCRRVMIIFSFSPCLVSFSYGIFIILQGIYSPSAWLFGFIVALLGSLMALFLYGVPAFFLGCVCCYFKLRRTIPSLVLIFLLGGIAAYIGDWVAINIYGDAPPLTVVVGPRVISLFGALASLAAGYFILPVRSK